MISFTGGDLPDPKRNLPRATYLALGVTTALYVLVAIGVFGTLSVQEVIANGDTALAVAAKPALGQAGFAMMAIAAMLATSSSVNANIYAAAGSTRTLAETGHVPAGVRGAARIGGTRGLVISCVLVLLLANFVDLSAIASLGSVVALAIFLVISVAAFRLRAETGSGRPADRCHSRYRPGGDRVRGPDVAGRSRDVCGDDRHPAARRRPGSDLESGPRGGRHRLDEPGGPCCTDGAAHPVTRQGGRPRHNARVA